MFIVLLLLLLIHQSHSFNLDTEYPLVITGREVVQSNESSFGFSVAFYNASRYGLNETLDDIGILIGAPTDNEDEVVMVPDSNTLQPGRIYSCSVSPLKKITCLSVEVDKEKSNFPNCPDLPRGPKGKSACRLRDHSLLGFTVAAQTRKPWTTMVCAPRWISLIHAFGNNPQYYPKGMCYYMKLPVIGRPSFEKITPFSNAKDPKLIGFGQAQAGFALHLPEFPHADREDGNCTGALIGAPGYFLGNGTVIHMLTSNNSSYQELQSGLLTQVLYSNPIQARFCQNEGSCYLGYSVSSGRIFGNGTIYFLAGMPKANSSGIVVIYEPVARDRDDTGMFNNTIKQRMDPLLYLKGHRYGESFGAAVIVLDLNNDGWEDAVVGAPNANCSGPHKDDGAVYLFLSNTTWNDRRNETISHTFSINGNDGPGARFGVSLAKLGDLNGDGFQDFVVGSPFGASGGTIHLFFGGPHGIKKDLSRRIGSPDNSYGFGWALSSQTDIDGNFVDDLAVGDFRKQTVHIFRSRPVVTWKISLQNLSSTFVMQQFGSQPFSFRPCLNIRSSINDTGAFGVPVRMKITLDSDAIRPSDRQMRVVFNSTNSTVNSNVQMLTEVVRGVGEFCFPDQQVLVGNLTNWSYESLRFPITISAIVEDPFEQQYSLRKEFCYNCSILSPESLSTASIRIDVTDCELEQNCLPNARIVLNNSTESVTVMDLYYQINTSVIMQLNIANIDENYNMYAPLVKLKIPSFVIVEKIMSLANDVQKLEFDTTQETGESESRNFTTVTFLLPVGGQVLPPGSTFFLFVTLNTTLIKMLPEESYVEIKPLIATLGQKRLGLPGVNVWTNVAEVWLAFTKAFALHISPNFARTSPEVKPYVHNNTVTNPLELTFAMSFEIANDGPEDAPPNSTTVDVDLPVSYRDVTFLNVLSVVVLDFPLVNASCKAKPTETEVVTTDELSRDSSNFSRIIADGLRNGINLTCLKNETVCRSFSCFLPEVRKGQNHTISATLEIINTSLSFEAQRQALLRISVTASARIQISTVESQGKNLTDISLSNRLLAQVTTNIQVFFENDVFPLYAIIGAVCGSVVLLLLLTLALIKFGFFSRKEVRVVATNNEPEEEDCHEVAELTSSVDECVVWREPIAGTLPDDLQRFQSSPSTFQ